MSYEHGGDIIGERLASHGVEFLFTLCGGHISPILIGAKKHGIRVVDVRDEVSSVFAADAVSRMSGVPGIAAVTAGPGLTNTITAVKNAQMAQSPLLVFGGATATILKGRGSLQDIDQMAIMKPMTKWATSVKTVRSLGPIVDRAIGIASEGIPGPVFIEVPVDMLYPEDVVYEWYMTESGVEKAKGLGAKALGMYLKGHLYRQFHAPHVSLDLSLPPIKVPFTNGLSGKVDSVANALKKASKPVLVIGSQTLVNYNQEKANALADAVRSMGIPTFLGGTARGLLGRHSDIQFRHKRSKALREADVVVVAGFPFDFRMGYGQKINRKATLISANLSATDLKKNRKPDIGLEMHPGDFLQQLANTVGSVPKSDEWFATLQEREDARDNEILGQAKEESELVNPLDLFVKMEEKMADDAVLVVDGGDFVATASYILRPRAPLSWLDPGVFGTLGVGGGFAVGAALCRPDSQVWVIYGDGSSAYSLAEVDTCIRHGLAPIMVIGTDGSWAQIARDQVVLLGDDCGTVLLRSDYHTVSEGYGGVGLLLTDPAKIDETLDKAIEYQKQGKPVVLNVHIAKSDFRKGSISI